MNKLPLLFLGLIPSVSLAQTVGGGPYLHNSVLGQDHWDYMGKSAAPAGDVSGDGVQDYMFGSPGYGPNGEGRVLLYSGADHSLIQEIIGSVALGTTGLGYQMGTVGDVTGDGIDDFLFGHPGARPTGFQAVGEVLVVSGADYSVIHSVEGTQADAGLGTSVAFCGDVNLDGFGDYITGEPMADRNGFADAGEAVVYSGQTGNPLMAFSGKQIYSRVGLFVDGGQDFNGDSIPDLLTWELRSDIKHDVFIYSGDGSGEVLSHSYGTFSGELSALRAMPDTDGDGLAEILLGRWLYQEIPHWSSDKLGWAGFLGRSNYLEASDGTISASSGGSITFHLDYSRWNGDLQYKLLGSATGVGPTTLAGLQVPLTPGDFLWNALLSSTPPAIFSNPIGVLDADGKADCVLNLPPGLASSFVGTTFYFAAVIGMGGVGVESSVAVDVTVMP